MDATIIPFPAADTNAAPDPVAERAAFFFDLEMAELSATIPVAEPIEPKQVY